MKRNRGMKILIFLICFFSLTIHGRGKSHFNHPWIRLDGASDVYGATPFAPENSYEKSVILSPSAIEELNKNIIENSPYMRSILGYKYDFRKDEILGLIKQYSLGSSLVHENGKSFQKSERNEILRNRNIKGVHGRPLQFGVCVNRSQVKSFPTDFKNISGKGHDLFAEDSINPWEEVVILHESADGKWYFIISESYYGWVLKRDIGIVDRGELERLKSLEFMIVTKPKLELYGITMDMGTKIPMEGDEILIPKNEKGYLVYDRRKKDVNWLHKGYLPFTEDNIMNIAMRFLGEPYGWGGSKGTHDCSSFVEDVYKTFGIRIPRNTGWQEQLKLKGRTSLKGLSNHEKISLIREKGPGSLIYMKGHVVMYLGRDQHGKDMIIHQNGSTLNCAISDLNFKNYYLGKYTTIQEIR